MDEYHAVSYFGAPSANLARALGELLVALAQKSPKFSLKFRASSPGEEDAQAEAEASVNGRFPRDVERRHASTRPSLRTPIVGLGLAESASFIGSQVLWRRRGAPSWIGRPCANRKPLRLQLQLRCRLAYGERENTLSDALVARGLRSAAEIAKLIRAQADIAIVLIEARGTPWVERYADSPDRSPQCDSPAVLFGAVARFETPGSARRSG